MKRPFGRGTNSFRGLTITMVINHLYTKWDDPPSRGLSRSYHSMVLNTSRMLAMPCDLNGFPFTFATQAWDFGRIFSMNVFLLCWQKSKVTTNDASNIICRAFDGWKPAPVEIENNKLLWTSASCTISISPDEQCSKPWLVVLIQEVKLPSSIGIMIKPSYGSL